MRIVVLRALGLGDLLTGVPALRALRRAHPDARIVLAAPSAYAPLVRLADAVDEVVDTPAFTLEPLDDWLHHADLAVNLHGRGPQSHRALLAARPRRLVAFAHESIPESAGQPAWRADEHEVARWCRLLSSYGAPADPADLLLRRPDVASPAPAAVVVHVGAASAARRWPVERWAEAVRRLASDGHDVVLTGSAAERPAALAVARSAGLGEAAVLAGGTPLPALAALVAEATLVLCGDTGVAHLASAYATPSVVLFGPVSPAQWGPPPRPQHVAIWHGTTGDPHAGAVDAGLLSIGVDEVLAAVARALGRLSAVAR